jgi:hypothetical protein
MTQEVQVILTLEVDVTRQKQDIEDFVERLTSRIKDKYFELVKFEVKEEVEIYKTEE